MGSLGRSPETLLISVINAADPKNPLRRDFWYNGFMFKLIKFEYYHGVLEANIYARTMQIS